ncbi:MAG: hypothetical protein ABIH92_05100 [Nanoarchaeota archaeon]
MELYSGALLCRALNCRDLALATPDREASERYRNSARQFEDAAALHQRGADPRVVSFAVDVAYIAQGTARIAEVRAEAEKMVADNGRRIAALRVA